MSPVTDYTNNATTSVSPQVDITQPFYYAPYVAPTMEEMKKAYEEYRGKPISDFLWGFQDSAANFRDEYKANHLMNYNNGYKQAETAWNNAYNTYSADLERRKQAGLNPYFADASVGSSSVGVQGSSPRQTSQMSEAENNALSFQKNLATLNQVEGVLMQGLDIYQQMVGIQGMKQDNFGSELSNLAKGFGLIKDYTRIYGSDGSNPNSAYDYMNGLESVLMRDNKGKSSKVFKFLKPSSNGSFSRLNESEPSLSEAELSEALQKLLIREPDAEYSKYLRKNPSDAQKLFQYEVKSLIDSYKASSESSQQTIDNLDFDKSLGRFGKVLNMFLDSVNTFRPRGRRR